MKPEDHPLRQVSPDMFVLVYGTFALIVPGVLAPEILSLNGPEWLSAFFVAMVLSLAGAGLLLWAKWPLYRAGKFFKLGAAEGRRAGYRASLWLSGIGCGGAALLVVQSLIWR